MNAIEAIFFMAVLIMSVVVHEVAHGFVALRYGDKTALYAGRLTLNPIKHLDLFGSIILPLLLFLSPTNFIFGWAKPVPYNPNNLSNKKWGTLAVASAGIIANFIIALVFGALIRFLPPEVLSQQLEEILSIIVILNLILGIFNLVPIPPLDGSKILFTFLPASAYRFMAQLERYSLILVVVFIIFFVDILYPILGFFYHLFTGVKLI